MSPKLRKYLRTNKRLLILGSILVLTLISSFSYMQYQVSRNARNQKVIVNYLQKNSIQQEKEKIQTHAIAIQQKIDKYRKTGNISIDLYVLGLYSQALDLASEGNKSCYVLEEFGDDILDAYRQGKKDGNKAWSDNNNSF